MLIREKMETTHFSSAEEVVIEYILNYPEKIENQTIQEIASETFTHPSTLIRVAKKLGYSGWVELRKDYLEEWSYLSHYFSKIDANLPFKQNDSIMTISQKLAVLEQTTIDDTLSLIHHDQLQKAKQILLKADHIKIYAQNANLLISQDFALKMNRIKKYATVSNIKGEGAYEAYNSPKNTCAILISYTGETSSLLHIYEALKEQNIPVIGITSIGDNELAKKSDSVLSITTREKLYSKIGNFTSNTSIIYLLNVLYAIVFAENYEENLQHLIETGEKVDHRKSNVDIMQEDENDDPF